jgi:hypothetical protein
MWRKWVAVVTTVCTAVGAGLFPQADPVATIVLGYIAVVTIFRLVSENF